MIDACGIKKDNLYVRYYCKECKEFHFRDSEIGQAHKEFKLNRYFCPTCNRTHISTHGNIFLEHLEVKGREISYYGKCCALKCDIRKNTHKTISDEQAKEILQQQQHILSLNILLESLDHDFTFDKEGQERKIRRLKILIPKLEENLMNYKRNLGIA